MIKHIGKHNDRKVAILYRTVPNEAHMSLVVYTEVIPRVLHDEIMKVVESATGQQSDQLADALFRHVMSDGKHALQCLHAEGYIKKVPANQIIVTPNAHSSVRLDELNDILAKMKSGEDATKRMQDIDNNTGMRDPNRSPVPQPYSNVIEPAVEQTEPPAVLSDADIATGMLLKAATMKSQGDAMIAESKRLAAEAQALVPKPNVRKKAPQQQKS